MLERIILRNFQKHARLDMELSPGINVIVGESDAGKSSVVRALRWLFFGGSTPGLCRHGTDRTSVGAVIDGAMFTRRRRDGRTTCKLAGKEYAAIGRGTPDEVAEFLRVGDLNFQGQMDGPFLLGASPYEAAKLLNRVVSLDLIDTTLDRLDAGVRGARDERKRALQEEKRLQGEVESFGWLDGAQVALEAAESARLECTRLEGEVDDLTGSLRALKTAWESAQSARITAHLGMAVAELSGGCASLLEECHELETTIDALGDRPHVVPGPVVATVRMYANAVRELEAEEEGLTCAIHGLEKARRGRQAATDAERLAVAAQREIRRKGCPLCGATS